MNDLMPFFVFLNKFIELSPDEFIEQIMPFIILRQFNEKEIITAIGAVENYFNFLLTGLTRTYTVIKGHEAVIQIAMEGHMIHVEESFHSRKPSLCCVESIEPCRLVSITYDDLETMYASSNKMQRLGRLVVTHAMLLKEKVQVQAATVSPRERFLHFIDKNPRLLQRVPQKYIASYLNIKPETFSRFKHMLRGKKV